MNTETNYLEQKKVACMNNPYFPEYRASKISGLIVI